MYLDIHTHLTHEKFADDLEQVVKHATDAGLGAVVVNGLEPQSNRETLSLAQRFPVVKPALGIYPIDAVNDQLPDNLPFRVGRFDVTDEIVFIREQAQKHAIIAVGECGLDGHWVGEETFAGQEKVFLELLAIAHEANLPAIVHTRKREQRAIEIVLHHKLKRVNFHCFGGKAKLALRAAEQGIWFSIPANARRSESFTKMLRELPREKILTETDAPFLAAEAGKRSEPADVVNTVAYLAELRGWSVAEARDQIWQNYLALVS